MILINRQGEDVSTAACTVKQAAALLGRSRRQIYRLLRNGELQTLGKHGYEHLVVYDSVNRLRQCPLSIQPVPKYLQKFFPEYRVAQLNAGRDRQLIVMRLLSEGGLKELSWLQKRYGNRVIRQLITQYGMRQLPAKALALWQLYFKATLLTPASSSPTSNPWKHP